MVTMNGSIDPPSLCNLDQIGVRIEPKRHGMAERFAGVEVHRDLKQFMRRRAKFADDAGPAVRGSMPKISAAFSSIRTAPT